MVRWLLVIHPEVREWLQEIRKTDRPTAALIEARYAEHLAALHDEDE